MLLACPWLSLQWGVASAETGGRLEGFPLCHPALAATRCLPKNAVSLSHGISVTRSYRSTCPAFGMMSNSFAFGGNNISLILGDA